MSGSGSMGRSRTSITSLISSTIMPSSMVSSSTSNAAENVSVAESETMDNDNGRFTYIDSFFDRFWQEMSVFAFERAKEIAEKEKEQALKSHNGNTCASSGFTWVILTTAMAQLAMTEKGYMNLAYLAPKAYFIRKDSNLKTMLESVRLDLKKIMDSGAPSSPFRHKNSQIASCLTVLINLRLEQMEFYDRLSVFGTSKNVEIGDLISDIEIIYERFKDEVSAAGDSVSILEGILKILKWESEIVISLLKSINMMQSWDYLEATIALQQANQQILEWTEILQNHSTTLRKSTFYNSPPNYPLLFLWIKKLKGALVSKYSLYFNELLAKNSSSNFDMKSYCSKLPTDFYGRMLSFQRKSDALCVSIIFDAKDTKYHPNGYNCAGKEIKSPTGLESFPAILSIPVKPLLHWPNIVMIISDRLSELNLDKLVGFYDSSMQATYFVQRIDPRMFLVVLYESKKSEKDAYTIKFMNEITMDLKCGRIFSALKTTK